MSAEISKRGLDREQIARAALSLLDEHGIKGFSVRGAAALLNVSPMALYHHVKNKAELAELVVELATRERSINSSSDDWREDLWMGALWTRQSKQAHPSLMALWREYGIWTPAVLQFGERWFSTWLRSGLQYNHAVLAAQASSRAISGLVADEPALNGTSQPPQQLAAQYPNANLLASALADPDVVFEISVRSIIDGLYNKLK